MSWLDATRARLRLLSRCATDTRIDEEIRFHVEMEAERLVREQGLDPREARRRALAAFGGVEQHKEALRDGRGLAWVSGMSLDLKLGLRMLRKYPGLSIAGGLGIAVGIAVSVGFFAFMSAHIFPVLPIDEGERLVALENRDIERNNEDRRTLHDFVEWREELRSVEDLAAFRNVPSNLITGDGPPDPVVVAEMTAAGFQAARVPPLLGRYLVPADEHPGAPAVIVLGHDMWQRRFGGDSAIVGRDIRLGPTLHTVVGVMPPGFAFPMNHEYWAPLRLDPTAHGRREGPGIYMFGRLAPGVTLEQAQAELDAIGRRASAAYPETHANLRPMVMPYIHSLTDIQGMTLWMVVQMQVMMSLLLVVVALNVAVLIYARTAARQGEIAVRSALGASRRRVVAQLFAEALVLSLVAAAVGLLLAHVGISLGNGIMAAETGTLPFWIEAGLRPSTVLYTVGVAVVTAVIIGVVPALQATGKHLQGDLRQLGGATGMRLGKTWTVLIVAQVAIAVAALPAAVNMGWTEIRGATTRPTYSPEEYLVASVRFDPAGGTGTDARPDSSLLGARIIELVRRLQAEPGVVGATWVGTLPGWSQTIEVEGLPAPAESPAGHRVRTHGVGDGYLALYGARILAGRGFGAADFTPQAHAVIVNQAFVSQIFDGERALGRRIRHVPERAPSSRDPEPAPEPWYEIVGVAEDLEVNDFDPLLVRPRVLHPVAPSELQTARIEVRVREPMHGQVDRRLRELVAAVDPMLRLSRVYSLADAERQERLAVRLVGLAIGLVLVSVFLLTAGGIYALTSFTVTQRRREIGIRTALGAHPRQLLRSIFTGVARQIALGVGLGVVAAAGIDYATGGELMGGRGGLLLPIFAVLTSVVAFAAAVGPARRGLRIQPTEALRAEG